MIPKTGQHDVLLSYSLVDADSANHVARSFHAAGLRTLDLERLRAGEGIDDDFRLAVAESAALVAIVEPRPWVPQHIPVEIGAVWVWDKPVYILTHDPEAARKALEVSPTIVYHMSRIDEVVISIKKRTKPLSLEDREALVDIYRGMRMPVNRLAFEVEAVDQLADEFRRRQRKRISDGSLIRELLQLHKQGRLTRRRRAISTN